jgi:biopolymer transport protein ExbB
MLTTILAAAAPKENPYGLLPALREGGLISQTVFGILVIMLFFSLYILFTKLFEQQKIIGQQKRMTASFWNTNSLR